MVQTDLSILTALLCGAKERKSPPHLSGQEKCLNPYLVYRVALPILADQDIFLEDICYEEFEQDDLQPVARFFLSNCQAAITPVSLQTEPSRFLLRRKK